MDFSSLVCEGLVLAVMLSGIPLGCALVVGLISSVFQAATQIQEHCLGFVPKAAAVAAVLFFLGPWFFGELVQYLSLTLQHLSQPVVLR